MKTIISKIYFDNILKFPGRTLIVLIVILFSSSIFISNFKLDASADSLILENDKDLMTYRETTKNYSTNDFVIFTFTPNKSDIFNSRSLDAVKDLKGTILELDGIESVVSIVDIPLVESSDLSFIEMIENVPNILSESVNLSRAKKEILNSPIYKNLIISEDGNTTAIQINLVTDSKLIELARYRSDLISKKINEDISKNEQKTLDEVNAKYQISKKIYDERIHSILNELRRIKFEFESKYNADIKMGGIPMIADDMIGYVKSDLINFGIGVFIFILTSNLSGLVPGFPPATESFNLNLALGVLVFVVYNASGFWVHGFKGYMKHFMGPFAFLAPVFFCLELVSHAARPLSLSFRLAANIFGDHMLLGVFAGMVPLVVPAALMVFGLLVACIQTFVFTMLTSIYISMAISHDH